MRSFKYVSVRALDEAFNILSEYRGKAKLIAGGTDLLRALKNEIHPDYPEVVIDLKTIPNLDYIEEDNECLKVGSLVRLVQVANSSVITERYSALAEAAQSVGSPQIRNMGTIGGNLCQDVQCWYYRSPHRTGGRILCTRKGGSTCFALSGDNRYHSVFGGPRCVAVCPSDTAVALSALDAKITIAGPARVRTIPIAEFFTNMGNVLAADEILTEIRVPRPTAGSRQFFLKFRLREAIDFGIVSVAAVIAREKEVCKDVRITLGAVAPTPIRAREAEKVMRGKVMDASTVKAAVEAAVVGAVPLSMNAYKIHLTKALIKRAIT